MVQLHLGHGLADPARLVGVQRIRQAGGHIAEGAGAGADLAHDHHGGVADRPALTYVWAGRLFADRGQLVLAHQTARLVIAG